MSPYDLPPVRPIPPSPGGQLAPNDIVGHDDDIARAWQMLDRASLRLNEPRRIGKTSLLIKMESAPPLGWVCVRQSFQGVNSLTKMAERALSGIAKHQSLPKRSRDKAKQFLGRAKVTAKIEDVTFELSPAFSEDPVRALELGLQNVASSLGEDRLLLAWDEVPDMLYDVVANEGPAAAALLLEVLRRLREESPTRIRWLMTGSVGLHHVLRSIDRGDSFVNDLDNLSLGPLDEAWATWLAGSLLLGGGIEPGRGVVEEMARVSGGIPYLLHLIVAQVEDRRLASVAASDIEQISTRRSMTWTGPSMRRTSSPVSARTTATRPVPPSGSSTRSRRAR